MTDEQLYPSVQWDFSDQQREVAEYLAAGYSQRRAAAITKVGLRTINRWWCEEEEYPKYVEWLRIQFMNGQRSMFQSSVIVAQSIYFKALTGDADPDDPSVDLATRLLERTVWRNVGPGDLPGVTQQQQLPPAS